MKTSLNHAYRLVWSDALQTFVPVAECARGRGKGGKKRARASSLLLGIAMFSGAAVQAQLPTGGQVVAGSASMATQGKTLTITQTSDRMAADWQSFSIGQGHTVNFVQPSSSAVALNRVLGSDVSVIQGALNANGQVFLVNPNGVLFTKDAQVNVGGIVASTLNISTQDFMAGHYKFEGASSNAIVNQGNIAAHGNGQGGGTVALIAAKISNEGTLTAEKGNVLMGAGRKVTLDLGGPVKIQVEKGALDALIEQGGAIKADGGLVYLSAKAAGELASSVINHTGLTEAKSLSANELGEIMLDSGHAVIHTGTLDVSGITGGRVSVQTHNLVDAGKSLANGENSGGEIRIDASGRVLQTSAASLQANSGSGTGGSIRIEAGESAWLSGSASATGRQGGDISLTAPELTLTETRLDASGSAAGGRIRVGGGWQGKDSDLANALRTRLVAAELDVSATHIGNGGTAVIWSENETLFGGHIAARGGAQGGNGGQVEVSSHDQLGFGGLVDAHAPQGENGHLLLDPKNLEIVASVSAINVLSLPDPTPSASEAFGSATANVAELKNNGTAINRIVVASQLDDVAASNAGAVYVYNSQTGALISTLTGSKAEDRVGQGGVTALTNGNFVVRSQSWDDGALLNVGAVTWGNGLTGVSGLVSASNSLIGRTTNDNVGNKAITVLNNGNYVVTSPDWNNGVPASRFGAVTWGNGSTGTVGVISASNSLIGSTASDQIGSAGVVALSNGNYVVASPLWDNGAISNAGAATWGNGSTGATGVVSASNSLVGTKASDSVGGLVVALTNGNYVVASPSWGLTAGGSQGAVTWGNGSIGITGEVTTSNSLHGSTANDRVGIGHPAAPTNGVGVFALTNGNYVVASSLWSNGGVANAGAVTWGDGNTGITGAVSTSNSLVGDKSGDLVGSKGVTALTNGNYVVRSADWGNGTATMVGAATWGNGSTGTTGVVSAANSLVGSTINDQVSLGGVIALSNGNYVVNTSATWDNVGAVNAGAITWGNGSAGTSGVVSSSNSLVGTTANDNVGSAGVVALTNGNYVVTSPFWDKGQMINVGAVTWGNGSNGISGAVSDTNSLVGGSANDQIGRTLTNVAPVVALSNGNYVVTSPYWNGGTGVLSNGAVTWGNGTTGTTGTISASNSMLGEASSHSIGSTGIFALANGAYLVRSQLWDNGAVSNVGAVTWVSNGSAAITGTVTASNSIFGSTTNDNFGNGAYLLLADGRVLVGSSQWDNNGVVDAGRLDILSPGTSASLPQSYGTDPGANSKLLASTLLASLNAGTAVTLQANNDITLSTALTVNNGSGNGGHLTLQAGRSILLNANITTDDGNLTLIANDTAANGVVDAYRDAGAAVITQATGTSINAGTGTVTIVLRDGAGKTNSAVGTITLASISAADLLVQSHGFTASAIADSKVFDGTAAAVLSSASLTGLAFQTGSNLSLVLPTTGSFVSSAVANAVSVNSATFKVGGYSGVTTTNLLRSGTPLTASSVAAIDTGNGSGGDRRAGNASADSATRSPKLTAAIQSAQQAGQQAARQATDRSDPISTGLGLSNLPTAALKSAIPGLALGSASPAVASTGSGGLAFVSVNAAPAEYAGSGPQPSGNAAAVMPEGIGRDPAGFMQVFVVNGGINLPTQASDAAVPGQGVN